MYTGNSTTLQDGNVVNLKRGVLQGDPLLPLLFNLMIDEALESIDNQGTVLFEGIKLSHIAFADDLVILANDTEQLNQKIQVLNKNMNRLGMSVNSDKSAICHLNFPHGKLTVNYRANPCIINKKEIPQMNYDEKYKYLGIHIDPRGNMTGTSVEETRAKLEIINKSPLKAQQKVEILRDITSMQIAYQLESMNATGATVNKFNLLLREYTKKWLRIRQMSEYLDSWT